MTLTIEPMTFTVSPLYLYLLAINWDQFH